MVNKNIHILMIFILGFLGIIIAWDSINDARALMIFFFLTTIFMMYVYNKFVKEVENGE